MTLWLYVTKGYGQECIRHQVLSDIRAHLRCGHAYEVELLLLIAAAGRPAAAAGLGRRSALDIGGGGLRITVSIEDHSELSEG